MFVGLEIITTFPPLPAHSNSPHIGLQRAVWAGDGGAAGETRHPVAGHGERVLGVGRHGGEWGGDPRVGPQTPVAGLVVAGVAGSGVSVTEGAVARRVEGEGGEYGACNVEMDEQGSGGDVRAQI